MLVVTQAAILCQDGHVLPRTLQPLLPQYVLKLVAMDRLTLESNVILVQIMKALEPIQQDALLLA